MHRRWMTSTLALAALLTAGPATAADADARSLRDRALAELENERPAEAESLYRELVAALPDDPLPHANLAIALLRQQKYADALESIDAALGSAPGRGDLLAIRAEVQQWNGDLDGAVDTLVKAVASRPDDPEIQFALLSQAANADRDDAERAALGALSRLRPENLVVLLNRGRDAVARGDRTVATAAFDRIEELLWGAPPIAERAMALVREALAGDDLAAAKGPAQRLENVLKISPMFRESLRELRTGIQGIPVARFAGEPAPTHFGDPIAVRFTTAVLDPRPTRGRALATGDFDGDQRPDVARIRAQEGGQDRLEVRLAAADWKPAEDAQAVDGIDRLYAIDLDNDGHLDLVGTGVGRGAFWRGRGDGAFDAVPDALGLAPHGARAVAAIDFDIEGDLDLALVGPGLELLRNNLEGPLEAVGDKAFPAFALTSPSAVRPSDLDRDGDLDLLVAGEGGLRWLDNLRQGRFTDRSVAAGLPTDRRLTDVVAADFDNDGRPDLVGAGRGLAAWHNDATGRFSPWTLLGLPGTDIAFDAVVAFDADNDGRLDLAAAGDTVVVLGQTDRRFVSRSVASPPEGVRSLVSADLDGDGDLDLISAGDGGLHRLTNEGGHRNGWLEVRLRGLDKGNSKNNLLGVGSVVEVRAGAAYQFHEATGDVVHLGLGKRTNAETLRVVWTNGVPQNRLAVAGAQRVVEEQLLKGSCPFLYTWDGERIAFVTDLLWGAPIGLPAAPGVWVGSDPDELVRIDGAALRDGVYDLRITEELWEAAFFDHLRLWVVDHPPDVAVASNLRIVPGPAGGPREDRILGLRDLRPLAGAWDGRGRDVTARVARRDEVYADGYAESPYQGIAAEPWAFTFDLGEAPGSSVRLALDGWIFPADASLHLAVAQRRNPPDLAPRLEVELADGRWEILMEDFGHPAGKTKTTVVDTPPLPAGSHRLRIVTSRWLHWDRIEWSTTTADEVPRVTARLPPTIAELRFRGFSAPVRSAPNAPHAFDYALTRDASPWLPFPGRYTRFGDVRPLLESVDDQSVIMAPGDEMHLVFDPSDLPPPPTGWQRTLFLESHGWDKDADRNTGEGLRMEPLPFRAMTGYPYGPDERYPETPAHDAYREEWLVREVGEASAGSTH